MNNLSEAEQVIIYCIIIALDVVFFIGCICFYLAEHSKRNIKFTKPYPKLIKSEDIHPITDPEYFKPMMPELNKKFSNLKWYYEGKEIEKYDKKTS